MKTRKSKFLQAVRTLAPNDHFIYQAAQRVPEEKLPAFPGGAALEFVVAVQKLREPVNLAVKPNAHPPKSSQDQLSISHQLRIKSAEYWLLLGEADQALRELEALSSRSWTHSAAQKARVAALGMLGEVTVQE